MAQPRKAHISGTVTWSNGTNFDGFLLLGLAFPLDATSTPYAKVGLSAAYPAQRLPQWTVVPIKDGAFNQNTTVFFNSDIEPPNCRYVAYWYDTTKKRIFPATGTPPVIFDIAVDPFVISLPVLTAPTATVTSPVPEF